MLQLSNKLVSISLLWVKLSLCQLGLIFLLNLLSKLLLNQGYQESGVGIFSRLYLLEVEYCSKLGPC